MFPPPTQNNVGVCNQITLLIPCYIRFSMVNLLKVIVTPIQVSDIFYLTVCFKFLNFTFRYSFFLFLKYLLDSRLTFFGLSTVLWFGSHNICILACFLLCKDLNILHQAMGYAASIRAELKSPNLIF